MRIKLEYGSFGHVDNTVFVFNVKEYEQMGSTFTFITKNDGTTETRGGSITITKGFTKDDIINEIDKLKKDIQGMRERKVEQSIVNVYIEELLKLEQQKEMA